MATAGGLTIGLRRLGCPEQLLVDGTLRLTGCRRLLNTEARRRKLADTMGLGGTAQLPETTLGVMSVARWNCRMTCGPQDHTRVTFSNATGAPKTWGAQCGHQPAMEGHDDHQSRSSQRLDR